MLFPKPMPEAVRRQERRLDEAAEYKRNALIARRRDGSRCRICGAHFGLETHHVKPRSLNRRSRDKHAVNRLLTVCGPVLDPKTCHAQLTAKTLKIYPNTDQGTDDTVLVEKWDKASKQWQVAMRAA